MQTQQLRQCGDIDKYPKRYPNEFSKNFRYRPIDPGP